MWAFLLDFLFPRRSLTGREGEWITGEEAAQLRPSPVQLDASHLRVRSAASLSCLVAAAMLPRSPLLRRAIHTLKYRRARALAEPLGFLLATAAMSLNAPRDAVLCPVPLHWTRLHARGFNQSLLLAQVVARERGWRVQQLLIRVRPTGSQMRRSARARRHALCGAFRCDAARAPPQHIILVDDVATTLTTLEQCASLLRISGCQRVDALVLAID